MPRLFPALITNALSLRSRNGLADPRSPLPAVQPGLLAVHNVRAFLHHLLAFCQDEFDVAWVGHVRVDLLLLATLLLLVVFNPKRGALPDRGHGMCVGAAWEPG